MKLSPLEQKLLGAISLQGDASLSELAKQINTKTHKCRYAFNALFEKGILTRRVIINSFLLGYSIHAFWFSLNTEHRKNPTALHTLLKESKQVGYFGEYMGDHPYRLDLYTRNIQELREFFIDLSERLGNLFGGKELSDIYSITDFPLKYLHSNGSEIHCSRVEYNATVVEIDDLDHRILSALSTIDRESHASIARTLGIPQTTLEYRIKRLREQKVIVGYHVWPNVERLETMGFRTTLHRIKLANHSRDSLTTVDQFVLQEPSVFSCTHYIGEWDLEICSSTRSKGDEEGFMKNLESTLGENITAIVSKPVIQHHKISNYPA